MLGPLRTQQRQAADQHATPGERLLLAAGEGRLGWMDQASCKGLPTERFFPEPGEGRKASEAKAICAGCEVQGPCRDLAVKAADSLDSDHGVFGGTVPTERSHLRPNRFPEPSAYRQDRKLAERAHELASRVGLRQAARELGASRDTLKNAWAHWNLSQPEAKVGYQPGRFLADRAEAQRAFRLAEKLGSVNAAAKQLGTSWPSLRKAFQCHQLGTPTPNPAAVGQRKSTAQLARHGTKRPTAPALNLCLLSSTLAPCPERAGTPARLRSGCAARRSRDPRLPGRGRHQPREPPPAAQRAASHGRQPR